MKRALLLSILSSLTAFAQDCTPTSPSAQIEVSLKKGAKLKDLATWYHRVTCREIEAPLSAADLPLGLTIEGKIGASRIIEVVRAAAASAGYEAREDFRKLVLLKAAEPCDPARTAAVLARVEKAATCSLDLDSIGCADGRVAIDESTPKLKITSLTEPSILHAIGLREGDELVDDKTTLMGLSTGPSFELKLLRAGAPKTIRCEIAGDRNVRFHPASLLREALLKPDASTCSVDPGAITTKGDAVEVIAAKAPALDVNCLSRACRIVPAFKDGKSQGLKLFSIRPNTVLAVLGFQNGDTVKSINGRDLDTPDKALEVYSALRTEKKFSVTLERRGEPKTLTILVK